MEGAVHAPELAPEFFVFPKRQKLNVQKEEGIFLKIHYILCKRGCRFGFSIRGKREIKMTDEQKWQAVLKHDDRYDGLFFVGVKSTKIFCRPSCKSKRPLR
ncbi:MAG: hypothetical protein LBH15_04500, partial [Treponema sp.]|nr:hypothetical protein [Treponema sp.]